MEMEMEDSKETNIQTNNEQNKDPFLYCCQDS